MELKQLQSFCAVVKYKSFTKAAEKLYLSSPPSAPMCGSWEEEFQTSLIVRTTKSVEVTPRGQELYECSLQHCKSADNLMRSWSDEDRKNDPHRSVHHPLRLYPAGDFAPLPSLQPRNPVPCLSKRQSGHRGWPVCGAFDMGLIGVEVHEEMLELTPFYADQMVLITPVNEHFLRFRDAGGMTLADICREPCCCGKREAAAKNACPLILSGWVWMKTT